MFSILTMMQVFDPIKVSLGGVESDKIVISEEGNSLTHTAQ
jgi:hypothetical protein